MDTRTLEKQLLKALGDGHWLQHIQYQRRRGTGRVERRLALSFLPCSFHRLWSSSSAVSQATSCFAGPWTYLPIHFAHRYTFIHTRLKQRKEKMDSGTLVSGMELGAGMSSARRKPDVLYS